jgi:hypothetical protein
MDEKTSAIVFCRVFAVDEPFCGGGTWMFVFDILTPPHSNKEFI